MGTQTIAYAATIAPAISSGNIITVGTLTGDIEVQTPTGTTNGEEVRVRFQQSAAGGNKVTLYPKWKLTSRDNNHPQSPNDIFYFYGTTQSDGSIEGFFGPVIKGSMADPMTTIGDMIYRDTDNVTARLPIGPSGTAPVSNGSGLEYDVPTGRVDLVAVPSGYLASGTQGEVSYSGDYLYFCVLDNTWVRSSGEIVF